MINQWNLNGDSFGTGGAGSAASTIVFTPTGTIAATNVQTAIAEAASEALQATQAPPTDCSDPLTGKVIWNNSLKLFTCSTDQTTAGGAGITTLNTLSGAVQTFANDTNVQISSAGTTHTIQWIGTLAAARLNANVVQSVVNDTNVTGSISAQALTLGWTGTLAKARQNAATVYNDASNTFSTGTQDLTAVTALLIKTGAAYAPTASGSIGYNTTSNKYSVGVNGSNTTLLTAADTGSAVQAFDSDLSALAANSTLGLWAVTGSGTGAARTLTAGTGILITNPAGTAGNPTFSVDTIVALTNQANTFGAGFKQSVTSSATTAGLRIVPVAGDPSSPADGDIWYNSSSNTFRKRQNGSTTDLDTTGGSISFTAVTAGTNVNALLIGTGGTLGPTGTGTITANRTGCAAGQYLAFDGTCPSAGGDLTANYTWTGTHNFQDTKFFVRNVTDATKLIRFDLAGQTTATTRVYTLPDASTRLIGDSDFSTTGMMVRTAANTYAGRTLTGTTNYITLTNGNGVSGNPTFNIGANVVATDRTNTYTSGDNDFGLATSLQVKRATGYAPTTASYIGFNTTNNRFVGGDGSATRTFAYTSEIQPLNATLTSLAGLTGVNAAVPYFTGASAMSTATFPSCADTGGQHINVSATSPLTFTCGTSSASGLSGLTTNTYPVATSATTLGNGQITQSGSVISMPGVDVGSGIKGIFDFSALASSNKTYTFTNFSGTVRTSTGAITAGHVLTTDANGQIIDGGAAGSGTWTDGSTNTGTNKTLVATEAGGTNTLTTGIKAFWDGASLTLPSASTCTAAALTQINSGPSLYTITCTDASTSTFEGQLTLSQAVTTVTFTLTVNDVDSSSQHFAGDFSAQCRNNNTTVNNTWGTSQSVDITMTTASNNYTGTTSAVTPNGTCSAGATLFWRFVVNTTPFTDDGDARVLGVLMKQAS